MVPSETTASKTARRSFLTGAVGVAAALAGCSGSESHSSPPEDGTIVTDHVTATTRSTGDRPPIVAPREDAGGNTDDGSTAEPITLHTVESEDGAEAFEFAEDATNVAAARRLLAETDYDSESVFVFQTRIGECYRLKLNYVTRGDDGDPNIQFCRVIRDAHTACEREASDHTAALVRLPFPADGYDGLSAGSGGSCDPIPDRYNGSDSS
ncbi:hypothetical protein ACFQEQ_14370 [Halolamina salina]|uniref:hypothetical protein n=1 Tax=Halolamina salina TaxID=1220023 RepID=UPI003605B8C9